MHKVAVTIPEEVLRAAKAAVRGHRAKTLSAFVSTALAEKLERDNLEEVLDAMDAELGPPNAKARAWAKKALRP
jgi:hypothetical protein